MTMPWRLIPPLDAPGMLQMAIDTWLLQQHQQGHPPTLRFYTWNTPTISLGRSQKKHIPDHWRSLTYQGKLIDLVHRPTGGRGVLHQGDLTYAVITNQPGLNQVAGYQAICDFLITGWAKLGVNLHLGQPDRAYMKSQNCFGLATTADLVDEFGNKFIGSARYCKQQQRNQWVLQHGAMLLNPDPDLFQQVFGQAPPQPPLAFEGQEMMAQIPDILAALTEAATSCFDSEFHIQPLTPTEWSEIEALATVNQNS